MQRNLFNVQMLVAALIFYGGLVGGLAQSGQGWPRGAQEILKLEQAGVSDDTIIAYIKNSNLHYKLNPSEIVMFQQQGVSDRVLAVMQEPPPPPPVQPPYKPQPAQVVKNKSHHPFILVPSFSLGYGSGGNWFGGVGLNGGWIY